MTAFVYFLPLIALAFLFSLPNNFVECQSEKILPICMAIGPNDLIGRGLDASFCKTKIKTPIHRPKRGAKKHEGQWTCEKIFKNYQKVYFAMVEKGKNRRKEENERDGFYFGDKKVEEEARLKYAQMHGAGDEKHKHDHHGQNAPAATSPPQCNAKHILAHRWDYVETVVRAPRNGQQPEIIRKILANQKIPKDIRTIKEFQNVPRGQIRYEHIFEYNPSGKGLSRAIKKLFYGKSVKLAVDEGGERCQLITHFDNFGSHHHFGLYKCPQEVCTEKGVLIFFYKSLKGDKQKEMNVLKGGPFESILSQCKKGLLNIIRADPKMEEATEGHAERQGRHGMVDMAETGPAEENGKEIQEESADSTISNEGEKV